MEDTYIKLLYELVYTHFTDKENPLWSNFFNDEDLGYNRFKSHVIDDQTLDLNFDTMTEDNYEARANYTAGRIMWQINRMEHFRKQSLNPSPLNTLTFPKVNRTFT